MSLTRPCCTKWCLPFELRLALARDSSLLSAVLHIVVSEIDKLYKRFGQEHGVRGGATGIVSATQYFGGAMNLNPHFHLLAADGVFSTNQEATAAVFTPTRAPATSELCARTLCHRCLRTESAPALRVFARPEALEAPAERCIRRLLLVERARPFTLLRDLQQLSFRVPEDALATDHEAFRPRSRAPSLR
jgi:hypothetical protein